MSLLGSTFTFTYKKGDNHKPRTVYCFDINGDMLSCWDFTNDGYRKFDTHHLGNVVFNDEATYLETFNLPSVYVEKLQEMYTKDGIKTFHDTVDGNCLVVWKPKAKLKACDLRVGQCGLTKDGVHLLRTHNQIVNLDDPNKTWSGYLPDFNVELVTVEYKFSK